MIALLAGVLLVLVSLTVIAPSPRDLIRVAAVAAVVAGVIAFLLLEGS